MQHHRKSFARCSTAFLVASTCLLLGALGCSDSAGETSPEDEGEGGGSSVGDGDGGGDGDTPSGEGGESSDDGGLSLFPEEGKRWLFIGQDLASIDAYSREVGEPQGIVSYTSLVRLEGIDEFADNGGGPNHLDQTALRHPDAPIAIGLYLVDYLDAINSGDADDNIARLGELLARYEVPVLLRIGYEFDADWTHYPPDEYIPAYQRIADAMPENVALVWQSAGLCGDKFMRAELSDWYPGDEYVDWVAFSYFRPAACGFSRIDEVVEFAEAHSKPVFIAESTPQGADLGEETFSYDGNIRMSRTGEQIWEDWFAPYFQYINDHSDVIRATTYINADWDAQRQWGPPYANGYWGDTRVQANETILENWQNELAKPEWALSP